MIPDKGENTMLLRILNEMMIVVREDKELGVLFLKIVYLLSFLLLHHHRLLNCYWDKQTRIFSFAIKPR